MFKYLFTILIFLGILLINSPSSTYANHLTIGDVCTNEPTHCPANSSCQFITLSNAYHCRVLSPTERIFGRITSPKAIEGLGFGSIGISKFLNNLIALIYILAAVVFVFMLLIGAVQWISSGGNKESIDGARKRIMHAIIGIVLFAIVFALLNLLGIFTGFTFFVNQNSPKCSYPAGTKQFFIDPITGKCTQKVKRDNVMYDPDGKYVLGECTEVFIEVDDRFCDR